MNHKPGSVTKSLRLFVLEFYIIKPQDRPPKEPFPTAIYLGQASQPASVQSTRSIGRAALLLLDFAPDEVCRAGIVANTAVGSYPAISPLPIRRLAPGRRYIFCCAVCRKSTAGKIPTADFLPGVTRHHALRSPDFPPIRRLLFCITFVFCI